MFDSHGRNVYGLPDMHGTCILLEVSSVTHLVEYFKSIYNLSVLFELKGIKIFYDLQIDTHPMNMNSELQIEDKQEIPDENRADLAHFSAVFCFYSICFSTTTSCTYWKSHTLSAIADHA